MAWDGQLLEIHPTETGWKETFRVHPLQHIVVAFRPTLPTQPFEVPNSIRLIDPTMPEGYPVDNTPLPIMDPSGELAPLVNHYVNLGWEYVWHCHILSHEEMDMMRPLAFAVPPYPPVDLGSSSVGLQVTLTWTDGSSTETGFTVMRSVSPDGPWIPIATVPAAVGKGTTCNIWTPDRCWAGDLLLSGGGCKPDRRYVCLPRTFDWLPDPGSQVSPHQYGDSDSPVINSTSARQMRFAWQLSKKRLPCNQGSLCHLRQENLGTKQKLLDDG